VRLAGKRRRRWRLLLGLALALVLLLPFGCSMLSEFHPAIDTTEMRAGGLASRFVDFDGMRVHYVAAGVDGPARVLFVHGSPGTWDAWKSWMTEPRLRERAHLLAPDRPGFGGSARGVAEPSLERQARALAAVLDAEGGGSAIVAGHSLGGPIAVKLAMLRPDLVAGLLLVAPSIDPALEKRRWYNVAGSLLVVQWFLPVDWTTSNRELWPLRRELEAMLPGWSEIAVPTIVVQGGKDDLVPPGNADFAERMMGARVDVRRYPERGHFILWQEPESVTEPLLELLGRTDRMPAPGSETRSERP
jgi:pimeloyl-ACP methyl ester carboxylesterase